MDLYSNLVEAEQRLVALVSSIEADSYSSPTPCDRWDVRALLSHALASIDAFAAAVDGAPGPDMAQVFSGADIVGDDPSVRRSGSPGGRRRPGRPCAI